MTIFYEPSRGPLPQPTFEDVTAAGRKGLVSMIPFVGAVGAELVGLLSSPVSVRRDAWWEDMARRLHELEGHVAGFHFEQLADNEQFVSATLQATQAALRTHQQEKLDGLRNAVLNVAAGRELDADRQAQFIALVDRFTVILLRFFQDPAGHFSRRHIAAPATSPHAELLAYQLVSAAMPEFCEQLQSPSADNTAAKFQILQVFFDDLTAAKLIALQRLKDNEAWIIPHFRHAVPYPLTPLTTHLGDDFLAFISEPRSEEQS